VKREAGERPARTRHCIKGVLHGKAVKQEAMGFMGAAACKVTGRKPGKTDAGR